MKTLKGLQPQLILSCSPSSISGCGVVCVALNKES
jgi:hypothetical protein